jgi:hypothetical protein
VGTTKYDTITSVPAASTATATTLWTSDEHDDAGTTATFTYLAIIPDPDETLSTSLSINLRLSFTDAGGAVTANATGVRATRDAPFILTNSFAGAPGSAYADRVTKVEAYNKDATNAIPVRTLVLF